MVLRDTRGEIAWHWHWLFSSHYSLHRHKFEQRGRAPVLSPGRDYVIFEIIIHPRSSRAGKVKVSKNKQHVGEREIKNLNFFLAAREAGAVEMNFAFLISRVSTLYSARK